MSTRAQSMPGVAVSASRNSNCDAPVAAMTRASPARAIASPMAAAARSAAARPSSCLVSKTRIVHAQDADSSLAEPVRALRGPRAPTRNFSHSFAISRW